MRARSKIWTFGFTGSALIVGALMLFVVPVIRNPVAVASAPPVEKPVIEIEATEVALIVPVDSMSGPEWFPLTGE